MGPEQAAERKQGMGLLFYFHSNPMMTVPKVTLGRWEGRLGDRPVLYELSHTTHSMTI